MGDQYRVTFTGIDPSDADETTFIDDVAFTSVPEPFTWTLMLLSAAAALRRRRLAHAAPTAV